MLRTALTGTHLLRTGTLEIDLTLLLDTYDLGDARDLVVAKRAGERVAADPALLDAWRPRLDRVLGRIDEAYADSVLPEEPARPDLAERWLIEARRSRLK